MIHLALVPVIVAGICVYWWARWTGNLAVVSVVQPVITILCMSVAALSFRKRETDRRLTIVILAGLALALLGDFLNVDMTDPMVVVRGLVIFVAAYLTYGIGFTVVSGFRRQDLWTGLGLLALYAGLMTYLAPFLGDMLVPGLIYGLVLPFLTWRTASTLFGDTVGRRQALLLTIGAACLYLGDIEFALHSYPKVMPMLFGPFLYSGGQLLIALSTNYGKRTA